MRASRAMLALVLAAAGAAFPSGAADKKELKAKYEGKSFVIQFNLHVEDNEAEWKNFVVGDFVPLGTKATVKKIDTSTAVLACEDPVRTVKIDIEDANPDETFVLDRILGAAAPSLKGFSKTDLDAIKNAKIVEGMTRKALFLAVGMPPYAYTPPFRKDSAINHDPNADELTYMKSTYDFLKITLKGNKVVDIED